MVFYEGGFFEGWPFPYPGAEETIDTWVGYNGCTDRQTDAEPTLDLRVGLPGLDTVVTRYNTASPGGGVELWTLQGGPHRADPTLDFSPRLLDWLWAHHKP